MSSNVSPSDTLEQLREELATQQTRLSALETEYAQLLADPDVVQEDRDSTRILLEATRATVESAEEALSRMNGGTYGRCTSCGQPIPAERLEAIPDADMCVPCLNKGRY